MKIALLIFGKHFGIPIRVAVVSKCIYGKSLGVGTIRSVWASKCTYLFRQKPLGQPQHTGIFSKLTATDF